jgi:head-tail adaptor
MLTADEITTMRSTLNTSLPDTAQVQRRTLTPDGAGGFTESWSTVATVACRLSPAGRSPEERVIAERLTATSTWTLTVPALTDVQTADRVVVGSRTFEVAAALARSSEISRRVICVEVV